MLMNATEAVAHVAEKFHFSVNKRLLSWGDVQTPFYGLFRSDTLDVVGQRSVSADYTPHTTEDVGAAVESVAHVFDGQVDVRCYFNDGHYVNIMPSDEHRRSIFGTGDNVFPRIIIEAGYCSKAYKFTMGYYRDACTNLSMMSQVEGTSFSIRHTSGLRAKMDLLKKRFGRLRQSWTTLSDAIHRMQQAETNLQTFLEATCPIAEDANKSTRKNHSKMLGKMFERMQEEREATGRPLQKNGDFTVSVWEAYNAVQGYAQHDQSRRGDNKGAWNRVLLAMKEPSVRAAEKLALQLAS
jgi:hypothetical protein